MTQYAPFSTPKFKVRPLLNGRTSRIPVTTLGRAEVQIHLVDVTRPMTSSTRLVLVAVVERALTIRLETTVPPNLLEPLNKALEIMTDVISVGEEFNEWLTAYMKDALLSLPRPIDKPLSETAIVGTYVAGAAVKVTDEAIWVQDLGFDLLIETHTGGNFWCPPITESGLATLKEALDCFDKLDRVKTSLRGLHAWYLMHLPEVA